jgi:DNA-binding beta-propeller fold protein YncE
MSRAMLNKLLLWFVSALLVVSAGCSSSSMTLSPGNDAGAYDAGPGNDAGAYDGGSGDDVGDATVAIADGGASDASPTVDAGTADVTIDVGGGGSDAGAYDAGPGWPNDAGTVAVQTLTDGGLPAVQCLELPTGDLVFDPTRSVLYASAPLFNGRVVRIDPSTAAVTGSVVVGMSPQALAVSDDGSSLYVAQAVTGSVVRVDLASGAVGTPVSLGSAQISGGSTPRYARRIRAVPSSPTRYVVSRAIPTGFAGLALYDGTTLLGEWNGVVGGESIAFTSATVLFGYTNDSASDLDEFDVSSTGFQFVGDSTGVITAGYGIEITSQGGWIFATNGQAVNGANAQLVGQYPPSGPVWPDSNGTDVWFLDTSTAQILDFDRSTFVLKKSVTLPAGSTPAGSGPLVAWSPTGLAFRTTSAVCIVTIAP